VRSLLRDASRLPRPVWWLAAAAFTLPVLTWAVALALDGSVTLTTTLLVTFVVDLLVGLLIINLWEETAWTGFFQRRAMSLLGEIRGSLVTAVLFAGVHLPLAFTDAEGAGDVLLGCGVLLGTGLGLRLLIARLDDWSGRSLLTVGVLHASFNATASIVESSYDWIRLLITVVLGVAGALAGGLSHGSGAFAPREPSTR
jgi:membrane protease YdiL (CAAX protease family)